MMRWPTARSVGQVRAHASLRRLRPLVGNLQKLILTSKLVESAVGVADLLVVVGLYSDAPRVLSIVLHDVLIHHILYSRNTRELENKNWSVWCYCDLPHRLYHQR